MDPLLWLKYKKVKGSATYNFNIICILTIKSTTKNNIFIKKEGINHRFFTKSVTKNATFKLTIWIHNRALNTKGKCYI